MVNIDNEVSRLASIKDPSTGIYLYGRRAIMSKVPEASEWKVRQIIGVVRGEGVGAAPALSPAHKKKLQKFEEVSSLPRIEVKVPARKKGPAPKRGTVDNWVIGGDFHAPYHNKPACEIFYQVIEDLKPTKVILLGDLINLDPFSKYDKIPNGPTWLEDVATAGEVLGNVKLAAPEDAVLQWRRGNHEERLTKYLMRHDPLFYHQMDIPKLFMLSGNGDANQALDGWEYIEDTEQFIEDLRLVLIHGESVRKRAGRSVQGVMEDLMLSVIMGHSHRLCIVKRSSGRSRYLQEPPIFGIETGCLCDYTLDYMEGNTADWQQGFAVLSIDRSGDVPLVEPSVIEIHNQATVFRGKRYSA